MKKGIIEITEESLKINKKHVSKPGEDSLCIIIGDESLLYPLMITFTPLKAYITDSANKELSFEVNYGKATIEVIGSSNNTSKLVVVNIYQKTKTDKTSLLPCPSFVFTADNEKGVLFAEPKNKQIQEILGAERNDDFFSLEL